ncbi:MAG: hypothetical protein RL120_12440 [Gammaproteobacteria bacterium]
MQKIQAGSRVYKEKLIAIMALLGLSGAAFGQNQPDPAAIQAYLEQQRQTSPFEAMARMQVDIQYRDFLDALGGSAAHREAAEQALTEVMAARAEQSSLAVSGQVTPEQLRVIASYEYLRDQMATVLNSTELQLLDSRQEGMAELQLRKNYQDQMGRIVPDVTEDNREMVLDVLVKHMLLDDLDAAQRGRMSAEELVQQQLLSLMDARVELQDRLQGEQLEMVNYFLHDLRSNLFLNQSMAEGLQQ